MNRSVSLLMTGALLAVMAAGVGCTPKPTGAAPQRPDVTPAAQGPQWAEAMIAVAKASNAVEGVVLHVGDSTTRNNHFTKWVRTVSNDEAPGFSESDRAILKWSHAAEGESDKNGWNLAIADVNDMRTETAAKNMTTATMLTGGPGDLPPLAKLLAQYKPQVVVILLGASDSYEGRRPQAVAADMAKIVDACLAAGAIPVVMTCPPNEPELKLIQAYNKQYVALAKRKNVPVIDLYGEILARQPGDAWVGTLTNDAGKRLSIAQAAGPPTKENLAKGGYLLRAWVVVQKLKEIKAQVIDKAK
ncbi:hypothetical protein LCGC14_2732680 [marine sediment metagenome]|uniref:SGNH hydrolase-type esterase domain-containing protein n=1 Tax=marine sediment metagenome TaxID=412755 RepID=A0A0F9BFR6_9ZZZZ